MPANEIEYFVRRLVGLLHQLRRAPDGEWEHTPWWTFTNAANFSAEYQRVFGDGLTKDLVAAKGKKGSTRTIGLMAEAFVYAALGQQVQSIRQQSGYGAADRLLDAPTNEAWIDPWVAHLRTLGVTFVTGYRASALTLERGRIVAASLRPATATPGGRSAASEAVLDADWFVSAMPVEQLVPLLNRPLVSADPTLARLGRLETDWMNGIQYFLNRRPGLAVKGHVAFLESPWALTSIDQGLFWKRDIAKQYGNGKVTDIYSVDISDFFTAGIIYGQPARLGAPPRRSRARRGPR